MNLYNFEDHVKVPMPNLSNFTYSESTHFSEIFNVSYIFLRELQASVCIWSDILDLRH